MARATMVKILAVILVFLTWPHQSFQEKVVSLPGESLELNGKPQCTILPKTFRGKTMEQKQENGTDKCVENSSSTFPPRLDGLSQHTIEYITGALSTHVIPAAYTLAIAVGIPANIFILIFLIPKTKAFSTAILYFSLATSDLLLLLTLAFRLHYHLNGNHWVFGEAACKVVTACFYGNIYCSVHAITCISVMRYLAVVHPFLYKALPKWACASFASVGVWLFFGLGMVPELLVTQSYHLHEVGIISCHDVLPLQEEPHLFLVPTRLGLICVGFGLPFVVVVFAHVSILRKLYRSRGSWAPYIKASSLVFFIFVVCFAPSSAIHFAHYVQLYAGGQDHFYAYYNMAVCFCCFHSCLDPFLCILMSKTAGSKLQFQTFRKKPLRAPIFLSAHLSKRFLL